MLSFMHATFSSKAPIGSAWHSSYITTVPHVTVPPCSQQMTCLVSFHYAISRKNDLMGSWGRRGPRAGQEVGPLKSTHFWSKRWAFSTKTVVKYIFRSFKVYRQNDVDESHTLLQYHLPRAWYKPPLPYPLTSDCLLQAFSHPWKKKSFFLPASWTFSA